MQRGARSGPRGWRQLPARSALLFLLWRAARLAFPILRGGAPCFSYSGGRRALLFLLWRLLFVLWRAARFAFPTLVGGAPCFSYSEGRRALLFLL